MKDRALRAIEECKLIATMSEEPGRITRRFLTTPMHEVHAHLSARMEALGMTVRVDAAGNLRGVWRPSEIDRKYLILGSHIDTVPGAGAFDGVLGVALALEWVELAQQIQFPFVIELIAFSDEEGVRYGVPFLGSRAVAGCFDRALLAMKDSNGISIEAAMRAFGLDPGRIGEAVADADAVGFVEIHIEQGPVLEAGSCSVAAVTGIVGQTRINLIFTGHANHAGTTPMHLRHDALAAAAEWIVAVEDLARSTDGLAATVGKIGVDPNVGNVIPGVAQVSLEVRHANDSTRAAAMNELLAKAASIAQRRGIALQHKDKLEHPAVPMDERLTTCLADAIVATGRPRKTIISGAGHDAMVMAAIMPAAMLFLRSPGGISHQAAEAVLEEDVEASLHVGREFLLRLAKEIG
jgi:allantoate deiminase